MSAKRILLEQLATDEGLMNKNTIIIKKPYVLLPIAPEEPRKSPTRPLKQLRSRSENSHPRKCALPTQFKGVSIQNSPRFQITSRHKIIKTEQKRSSPKPKEEKSTIQQAKSLFLPSNVSNIATDLKDYLHFIRALPEEHYQISANFESLRRRNRREALRPGERQIFEFIRNLYISIYENLDTKSKGNNQRIFQNCRMYFGCFEKIKLEIIFSIHYSNNLHAKLRPFLVYERLIIFTISAFTIDKGLDKMSATQRQSLKLAVQLLIQSFCGLFQPIRQQEEQVVSNINEAFRMLKAIGEAEKKLLIIQKQMRKINSNRQVFIEEDLKALINSKQQWNIEQLTTKEMKIAWDYLKIPPVPYLPIKSSHMAYTLVIQLDHTLIYYDKETKILKYRPYIDMFLHKISQFYEIIAFTKAEHKYAQVLIGQIQRNYRYFSYILCQQHLSYTSDGRLIKDISRLGRQLNTLVVLDHLPSIYKNYSINGIKISSWYGDKTDKWLERIIILLETIAIDSVKDIRLFLHHLNESTGQKDQHQKQ